ncbi:MAG: deoxynucleoside kinase [Candidatus Krumholzibacteriia bacterium]|nr:deoxynucleoside kinase [bacterium]MCB9514921.1 deoxynucleoside kinase [Candidatus Latescibacterota bacterium]
MTATRAEGQLPGYIVVEGVIGVGKTSLARLLADRFDARLNLELVEENPFLPGFYADPARHAFQTQLFFLLSRYRQQQELFQGELFQRRVVGDYHFAKDLIFANITLSDEELALYKQVADVLAPRVPRPELVIYLQASVESLLERIARRGRRMEKDIEPRYLATLSEAYNHYFFHYRESSLLVVNTDNVNFVAHPEHFEDLVRRILTPFEGTLYYVPNWES